MSDETKESAEPATAKDTPPPDWFAEQLRGFGPIGATAAVLITLLGPVLEPLGGVLVLLWRWRSHTPWRELGFVRPRSWTLTVLGGVLSGIAIKLFAKSVLLPLLGADPINRAYHHLAGNAAAMPSMAFDVVVGAGFGEELVFRAFLFERLGKLFGTSARAKTAIVISTSLWFGLLHYPVQGLAGAEQATFTGLVFGTVYAITRSITLPMIAHAVFDLTALFIIYHDLETRVAHWFFR